MAAKVYFSREITPEKVKELYAMLGAELGGRVAVKLHSGERGNQNFLRPEFWQPIINEVGGTVIETNTAYKGERHTTEQHRELLKYHGWARYFKTEILDGDVDDLVLPIPDGAAIRENYVGGNIVNYDSMLVLSHFKGHPSGGFGGAVKQLSIGMASAFGKKNLHGSGKIEGFWHGDHDSFLESMADAAASVVRYFEGRIAYINVMKNMSVDCDCCAVAEDPCIADIGILASLDPIAIDQACVDLVYASSDPGKPHLVERIESRNGIHTLEAAAKLGFGSREYELVEV